MPTAAPEETDVLPVGFKSIVTRLDAGTLTVLMRALLQAEADAIGLGANAVVVSEALTEGDGGLDARIDAAPDDSHTIPPGLAGFQFKAYKAKTISNTELATELAKLGPTRILNDGGTYILVWQADLNDRQRTNAEEKLRDEASKIVDNPTVEIWDASTIVALAERYPAVVEGLELVEFGAVRGLPELERTLRIEERRYEPDDNRLQAIEQIRARASEDSDDAIVVTVNGLAGTGKTRLVAEALTHEGLRDRTLYADSADGLHTFISRVVKDERTSGILVVDELDEADRQSIYSRFAATRGRWRLVAIVPQTSHRLRPSGQRDIVLFPLEADATRRLIEETSGLAEPDARMVADVARGFPELAFRLAEELVLNPDLDLVRLAHLERPHDVLRRALPDEDLRNGLKPLALFTGLGVVGDLAYQLDEVAEAFGRDASSLRHVIEIELSRHRFVSAAGRYRSVSPTLVAIWLAVELIDETPTLDRVISSLSGPVQDAFFAQLELFGPEAGQLAPALERLLDAERFRRPEAFDGAAGRFLRASAAVVPAQVAAAIDEILSAATSDQIRSLPRRDLVWALQILLWWPDTWEVAVRNLYRFARDETESWANNATGQFKDAFSVYLSGSTVPYATRIGWLAEIIADANESELKLLGEAAAQGLERHHFRTVVGFRGGGEPDDWQPSTIAELQDARRAAWRQLLVVVDQLTGSARAEAVTTLGGATWTMVFDGLFAEVDADVRSRRWSSVERAQLLGDVQRLLRGDDIPQDTAEGLTELRRWLEGESTEERLTTALAAPLWELHDEETALAGDPPILVELAEEVTRRKQGLQDAVTIGRETADSNTRFSFLRLVAQRVGAEPLATAAGKGSLDLVVLAAAISVADSCGETEWVDRTLLELSASDPAAESLPLMVSYARVTDERIALALDAVEAGRASPQPLTNLRGGARFLSLSPNVVYRLLVALGTAGAFEGALGMTLQMAEADIDHPEWFSRVTLDLARAALSAESHDVMIDHYVKELVRREVFDPAALTELWSLRMRTRSGLISELDRVLTAKTLDVAPGETLERVVALIRDEASGESSFSLFASRDLALLSRVAERAGVDAVWDAIQGLTKHEFRLALHHMRWSGDRPDPLVARFLSSSRLAGYETEAFTTFFNTLGVVSGDYWRALVRERDRALAWRDALDDSSARKWAQELVARYEHDIEWQRAREEEEDFRLGR